MPPDNIQEAVTQFVADLRRIFAVEFYEAMTSAIAATATQIGMTTDQSRHALAAFHSAARTVSDLVPPPVDPTSPPPVPKARRTKPGVKRAPGEIAALTTSLLTTIKREGGGRIEPLAKALSVKTSELQLPLKRLLAAGQIVARGERRATTYYISTAHRRRNGRPSVPTKTKKAKR